MKLTPEQAHAAHDLALYAVNTRELYPDALQIMRVRATYNVDPAHVRGWGYFTRKARDLYVKEIRHKGVLFDAPTMIAAMREIREHYAEQQAEIAASMRGTTA